MVLQVTGTDSDGDAIARPATWDQAAGSPPMIHMAPEPAGTAALAPGERVLARLRPAGPGRYDAFTIRRLSEAPARILGVFRPGRTPSPSDRDEPSPGLTAGRFPGRGSSEGRITPTDRRAKAEWMVPHGHDMGAEANEIVLAEPLPQHGGLGLRPARVVERLGRMGDARSVSLICIHTHGIPTGFPEADIAEAERAGAVTLDTAGVDRTDLRDIPLVTIDGEDARDFDDAVFAAPDGPGFRLIVAIADVAHYVRSGSALDDAARTRGNSVYFPDRVVPMLPEALSNGWCSLRPSEERGCMFAEMTIDAAGNMTSHRFGRGLMRSAARLTYEQVQAAHDAGDDLGLPLPHLYAAFRGLLAARIARGTLDLDLPERRVTLDDQGKVLEVAPRPRLDSHRLIEEFMVLANVAAAETLEQRHQPCMYRVHAPPSDDKLMALREFLHTLGISLPPGNQVHPRDLDRVLRGVAGTPEAPVINEVMLRSQSQAAYSPDNIGHFGLALSRYAHFTSPIRRYADLLVHRALVRCLGLGDDGLTPAEAARFVETAEHITSTERRAALAERDAVDRYLSAYMAEKIGARFAARISGVTRFGLFVTVTANGASGIVPMAVLPDDFWRHDEKEQTLTGRRTNLVFRLAQEVEVRLAEATPVTGGLVFHIMQGSPARRAGPRAGQPPRAVSGEQSAAPVGTPIGDPGRAPMGKRSRKRPDSR